MSNRWGKAKNRTIRTRDEAFEGDDFASNDNNERIKEREEMVKSYLDSFLCSDSVLIPTVTQRATCCGYSQSLYCSNCCQLLIPEEELPVTLRDNKSIQLPFEIRILLSDLRNKATGIHAAALCSNTRQVTLLELSDDPCSDGKALNDDDVETTFVLFPGKDSIPIVSVASRIQKLIVLDCKWTRTKNSGKFLPELSNYQKVHLSTPPTESHFWRWHNAGQGMLSTIEAIFYASWEVSEYHQKHDSNLIDLLYIFGIQRALSKIHADRLGKPSPFSKEGKEERRALRRCIGTEKHLRDIEKDKLPRAHKQGNQGW
eukprot:CAMPEP_0172436194 /NCGR_PEP_ID=MMETSP1064-20121228/71597_1 /TAXON_ID=202472 /ORGANISM="Aulacoseira subarctica , Strain CCAP 1002/5" /LENGTH=314 /DNA_ID=CAMNT_0013184589 /DNA_START=51 /DNA_END=992 /DNA_ORIENTATION=-